MDKIIQFLLWALAAYFLIALYPAVTGRVEPDIRTVQALVPFTLCMVALYYRYYRHR